MENNYFLNIIVVVNPNYDNLDRLLSRKKKFNIVEQFIILYNSVKENFKSIKYKINIFHSIDYNDHDSNLLSSLDIDIYKVDPDISNIPKLNHSIRCQTYNTKLKNSSKYRFMIDCDCYFIRDPSNELKYWIEKDIDFISAYGNNNYLANNQDNGEKIVKYLCKRFDIEYPEPLYIDKNISLEYVQNDKDYRYPHFCAFRLIKDEVAIKIPIKLRSTRYLAIEENCKEIISDKKTPNNDILQFLGPQYCFGLILNELTKNWDIFSKSFIIGVGSNKIKMDNTCIIHNIYNSDYFKEYEHNPYVVNAVEDIKLLFNPFNTFDGDVKSREQSQEISYNEEGIIDEINKLILLWSPKCGCTTGINMMLNIMGFGNLLRNSTLIDKEHRLRMHYIYKYISGFVDKNKHLDSNKYFIFKIIRNPYSRIVSIFLHHAKTFFLQKKETNYREEILYNLSFEDFLLILKKYNTKFIYNEENILRLTYVTRKQYIQNEEKYINKYVKLENLDKDIEEVNKRLQNNRINRLDTKYYTEWHHFDKNSSKVSDITEEFMKDIAFKRFKEYDGLNIDYKYFYCNDSIRNLVHEIYGEDIINYNYS